VINVVAEKCETKPPAAVGLFLVRYGAVPEVARFADSSSATPARGEQVVVQTHRGLQLGTVLERLTPANSKSIEAAEVDFHIERIASAGDLETARRHSRECDDAFATWCARILQWNLNLELIDLEWTLDRQKLILYVLCERGPDSTKLALQAAAAGLGLIEVQPVSAAGLVQVEGSSCGSGGGGCGCSH
jgi:cell fate regulator YaaT (PSP1 superfamily)